MWKLTVLVPLVAAAVPPVAAAGLLFPPVLDRLPAGAISPEGWLLKQAHIQAAGLTGGLATWEGGMPKSEPPM